MPNAVKHPSTKRGFLALLGMTKRVLQRELAGHSQDRAAALAGAVLLVREEVLDRCADLRLYIGEREAALVELGVTLVAEPHDPVELVGAALALDHQAPAAGWPQRRMRHAARNQQHVALVHDVLLARAVLHHVHPNRAGELEEDLVARVDV